MAKLVPTKGKSSLVTIRNQFVHEQQCMWHTKLKGKTFFPNPFYIWPVTLTKAYFFSFSEVLEFSDTIVKTFHKILIHIDARQMGRFTFSSSTLP